MLRHLHWFSGLILGLLVTVTALSGAVLSVNPALERVATGQIPDNGTARQIYEFICMQHTGQGLWWLGVDAVGPRGLRHGIAVCGCGLASCIRGRRHLGGGSGRDTAEVLGRGLPRFHPGDLIGILVPDSVVPRFYSLASDRKEGGLVSGGLVPGALFALQAGDSIQGFVKPNPDFRPGRGRSPIILIGAGAGIGPLARFVRHNRQRHPMHLYFGAREPLSDFLCQTQLQGWLGDGRLARLASAFLRVAARAQVQDKMREDQVALCSLIAKGAQIIVCGGRDMGRGIVAALDEILAQMGLTAAILRTTERYLADVD